jgi:DNA polymerase I
VEKPYIFIDGLNVFMRHFAANPSRSLNGDLCGGIFGTLRSIQHLCERFLPERVFIVWEGGGSSRRLAIDKNYKENRRPVKLNRSLFNEGIPEEVSNRDDQLKRLITILNFTPVVQIYVDGCEADDVISYACKKNHSNNKIIMTSDKDYYQLINDNTKIWSPNRKILIDEEYILTQLSVLSSNFCVARCFVGDQSDGIKGARGAGFKTMSKRFPELGRIKDITYNDIINKAQQEVESGSKLSIYKNIINVKNEIEKNWKLMYLDTAMLSYDQVKKINDQLEKESRSIKKFDLMKVLIKFGLNQFDVHTFCISLKQIAQGAP